MKRLVFGSLSVLLLATATAPAVSAQQIALNPAIVNTTSTNKLTPFNLVTLAHRGYFKQQGIPSYGSFTAAYQMGKIHATDLVRAAIEANRLDADSLSDRTYLATVESQLSALENLR
jgi:hypothetical protein